jgi:uncharacterized protein (TIGR03437 family)
MNLPGNTLLLALLVPFLALAERNPSNCGTYPERIREELLRSQANREQREWRQLLRKLSGLAALEEPRGASQDIGEIAVLEEDAAIISRRNLFNLNPRRLRFSPVPAGYELNVAPTDFSTTDAEQGTPLTGLGDDDFRRIPLPFAFPYFGATHQELFLNSDGNLTFEESDTLTAERSLGRFLSGPPRIAPLFLDLDPTRQGAVSVLSTPSRVVITWTNIPEYVSFGLGPRNSFQVRLFPSGVIEFAYQNVTSEEGVVGISPGRLAGPSRVVRLIDSSGLVFSGALAERFTRREELDTVAAAQRFYETHEDAYDYLVFYNALGVSAGQGVVAFEVTVRNQRTGYGDVIVDAGAQYGSPRRLQAILNMGPLSQYPVDPNGILPARFSSRDTPLTVLAHEAGHLFLAFASVRDPGDPNSFPMLGRQSAHWNFAFNSEASLLEGNRILDRGPGAAPRFETVAVTEGFSALDQYLMGLRPKEEVPPFFYVRNPSISTFFSPPPQVGVRFDGQRRDADVDELIERVGRRTPDHTVSQRKFRFGFVLITPRGEAVNPAALEQLETYRREFEGFYFRAAGQRATAETTLRKSLALSLWPAAGVVRGRTANARLALASPATLDQGFTLRSRDGRTQVPARLRIPAGQREATFVIAGLQPGVDTLEVLADDAAYETLEARIQVASGLNTLSLTAIRGAGQVANGGFLPEPVVFRVEDQNRLPYQGVRVQAAAAGGGEVESPEAISDENGEVRFRWRPGAAPGNTLTLTAEGGATTTLTARGRPFLLSTSVTNAASFTPGLAPFGLHTIFGSNLSAGQTAAASLPWPANINGVEVLVNGRQQPLVYISDNQINFYLWDAFAGSTSATVQVVSALGPSEAVTVPYSPVQPGIFPAAILRRGDFWEVYATGLGAITRQDGLDITVAPVTAELDGQPLEVVYSGLAPGFVGLYQINVRRPAQFGPTPRITLRANGIASNAVAIPAAQL